MHAILRQPVAIVGAARTPIGRFDGALRDFSAVDLAAVAVQSAVQRARLNPRLVDQLVVGNVISSGLGQAPVKQVALRAKLEGRVVCEGVNAVCGSGLAAVIRCVDSVSSGAARVSIAAGMESCSSAPYLLGPRRKDGGRLECRLAGYRLIEVEPDLERKIKTKFIPTKEATRFDGLFWPMEERFMREYACAFADSMGYSADLVNSYAARSHSKAQAAQAAGLFREEIAPVGSVSADELRDPGALDAELKASAGDVASAYNSSVPADGAASVVLCAQDAAREAGIEPLALIVGYSVVSCDAADFLRAPLFAVAELQGALREAGRSANATIIEANEAFGVQLPLFERAFGGMDINVHGGAIALGHPLGASGTRILVTLVHAMRRHGHHRGIATICFGGGGAYAVAVEC